MKVSGAPKKEKKQLRKKKKIHCTDKNISEFSRRKTDMNDMEWHENE